MGRGTPVSSIDAMPWAPRQWRYFHSRRLVLHVQGGSYAQGSRNHSGSHRGGLANATPVAGSYAAASATFTLGGTAQSGDYIEFGWCGLVDPFSEHYTYQLSGGDTLASAAHALANAIASSTVMSASWSGGTAITLTLTDSTTGANGNRVGIYANVYAASGTPTETWTPAAQTMSGGVSPSAWHVSFPFSSFTETTIQRMWLTLAADMQAGNFIAGEFSATFANWTVTDPNNRTPLSVAAPGSVRIEESDGWATPAGYWEDPSVVAPIVSGWWSQGRATRSAYSASQTRQMTVQTHCQYTSDIYLGTWLDSNCGIVSAALDGGTPVTLDCYGAGVNPVRRKLFAAVAAGAHTVVISLTSAKNVLSSGWYFYFDFLECAVLGAVPDAPVVNTAFGVATDWDTNNSIYLSPERLLWAIQRLGLTGEIDHYAGVFWWMQHNDPGNVYTEWTDRKSTRLNSSHLGH